MVKTTEFRSDVIKVLSHITGQNLSQRDVTPTVVFGANLITVLFGVMLADKQVTPEEKQHFQQTLNHFIPPEGSMRQLIQLLCKGVKQHKIYANSQAIQALSQPLSEPEKLLLLGLAYQMSAADGSIDETEKQYLNLITTQVFQLNSRYGTLFETAFTTPGKIDMIAWTELQFLLNPNRFHHLDTSFIEAASRLLEDLQASDKPKETVRQDTPHLSESESVSYESLREFKRQKQKIDQICLKLYQFLQSCVDQSLIPATLVQDLGRVSQKLQSQSFRIAVVGEFSQGKSTLLNALLGEEIQPTRAIPCSGTVTVLRHGKHKRIICRYEDGHEELISSELYKEKASIPKEIAWEQDVLREELAKSTLTEIIFEHPGLTLCKNGVEIVDSPGLNEHPARTAITQQLLTGTDAVVFLTNASRPITKGERDLLRDLQTRLNNGNQNQPALNLFIVVNYIDLLRSEEDRQDVKNRIKNIVLGREPIITGENRIHFISAQSALDAIQQGIDNEYLKAFYGLTASLEHFLKEERGAVIIKQSINQILDISQKAVVSLSQSQKMLEGNIELSEKQLQEIIDKIGEVAGRDVKAQFLFSNLIEFVDEEISNTWEEWIEELPDRLAKNAANWSSNYSPVWQQKQLIQDYSNQFFTDLKNELENWQNNYLNPVIEEGLAYLDQEFNKELQAIKNEAYKFDCELGTNLSRLVDTTLDGIDSSFFVGNLMYLAVPAFIALPGIIAAMAAGVCLGLITGTFDANQDDKLKAKIFESGFEQFVKSVESIIEEVESSIYSQLRKRIEHFDEIVKSVLSSYETLLEQQAKQYKQSEQQRDLEKLMLSLKQEEIQRLQTELKTLV